MLTDADRALLERADGAFADIAELLAAAERLDARADHTIAGRCIRQLPEPPALPPFSLSWPIDDRARNKAIAGYLAELGISVEHDEYGGHFEYVDGPPAAQLLEAIGDHHDWTMYREISRRAMLVAIAVFVEAFDRPPRTRTEFRHLSDLLNGHDLAATDWPDIDLLVDTFQQVAHPEVPSTLEALATVWADEFYVIDGVARLN